MTRDDAEKRKSEGVIGDAHDNREELLAAISKLEWLANALHVAAERKRDTDRKDGPP